MKRVLLPVTPEIQQRFAYFHEQLNKGSKEKLSKPFGELLAELSCEILDRMFGDLLVKVKAQANDPSERAAIAESEKVVQQVHDTFKKYMPYSVSLFGNERLVPLVNYLHDQVIQKDGQNYQIFYVDHALLNRTVDYAEKVKAGDASAIQPAFDGLIKIVDKGVDHLIREPKKLLKFNFVIDKTLTGVVNMTTSLGYKRLEKLAAHMKPEIAVLYVDHFMGFIENLGE